MKTLTLVSSHLELPERDTLARLEEMDQTPRVSLFYDELNSDRLDEQFLSHAPGFRQAIYRGLPDIAGPLSEALIIKNNYDAVISWTERLALPFAFLLRLMGSDIPHVAIFSWISPTKKARILQRVHSRIDRIILMSSVQKEFVVNQLDVPPSRVALLKWGVDHRFWRPMDIQPDMICSAGSERRDYPTLVEAMRGLNIPCHIAAGTQRNITHPTVRAVLEGGPLPPNVTIGRRNYVDLRTLYARSKFVVIPILESDTDHGATSILEAMAMGKAVICSKTTGQVDVIQEGRTGLLVPHGNPSDLRKAIEYLWENPEVAEKLGAEGRRQVEREHAIETFVSNVKSIVSDVILSKKEDSDAKHSRTFVPATRAVNNVNIPSAAADAKPSPHGPLAPSRLKILMIFHFCPNPPPRDLGPAKRTYPLLREALRRHDVSVLTFGSPEEERSFRKQLGTLCDRIVFVNNSRPRYINFFRRAYALLRGKGMFFTLHSRKMQKKLDELCRENHFDLIHCATPLLGFHRFPTGVPLVSDTHNVEHDLLYRSFLESKSLTGKAICYVEYKLGKPQEIKNCEKFDAIVATTKRDYEVLHAEMPHHRISVIQNGVDPSFLEPLNIDVEPRTMVFTGLMSYFPNTHGILFFLNEVFPHIIKKVPSALLYIVGKSPSKVVQARASSNVIVTGFVEDVRPYIARSQVYIIPLLIGGGIRGKALEAMAMKKAIVSTSIGCEGITLKDGESVVVADDPIEFADSVVRLFDAPEERERLGRNAHATVVREYDWEQKGLQFDELYRSIVKERTIR